uniref:ATP-dependent Clp protease proteolytic subunit n=14 Tax=Pelargonium TaxID=4030 RepID=A0A0N7AC41_9ROSI|nr:clp protease proteolytic subunit [Pelargonium dichondrifolium]YP_009299329.1 clp protease proteolytic subunit [Pelargonium exstipulatum]AJA38383.1 clp protease proteolytic subunit [Pelargonium dichondrifolium]AJB99242.1 clp protease proteolytic subunit [Pelargonium exstipulatum]
MPVGVPKVPFLNPNPEPAPDSAVEEVDSMEEKATWVDLYNRLYRQRLLFLGQDLEQEIANTIIGLMIYLSIEDPYWNQTLYINSVGGLVFPGLAVYDTINFVPPDVKTVCLGIAASMASVILIGGTVTERCAFPHARVMIHQPRAEDFDDRVPEVGLEGETLLFLRNCVINIYVQRTNKPPWVVTADLERDTFMSATEAITYGIIDGVYVSEDEDEE